MRRVGALLVLLLAPGCGRDQPACVQEITLIPDDEVTSGGFSPRQMLAQVVGTSVQPATLVDGTATTVTLSGWREAGSAELVRSTPNPRRRGSLGRVESVLFVCSDTVRVPVGVEISTAEGHVEITASGVLTRPVEESTHWNLGPDETTLSVDFDDEELGTVSVQALPSPVEHDPEEMDSVREGLQVTFAEEASMGTVSWTGSWQSEIGRHSSRELLLSW